ncbi:MAG: hypothetical protein AAF378_09880 [Cyanobacteria bacterium P01_A01_bin.84]
MIPQINLRKCWGVIAALLALPQLQTYAQTSPPPDPLGIYQLSFAERLDISSLNIFSSEKDIARTREELLAPAPFNELLSRELPQLWKMRVRSEDVEHLEVEYKINPTNTQGNPFTNVTLEPLAIVPVSSDPDTKTVVVQGGVRLTFSNLSTAGNAGNYQGQLSVCVKRKDSGCL